ncbi:MAG TPA: hypothetical protein VES02_00190 [Dermatophilaceae bacterium]|nr:hypothetical protein [Dermatophilaceae bacterium]
MRLMMDAVGCAIRAGQGQQSHQGRHRHGGTQATMDNPDGSTPAQDFYAVLAERPVSHI